MKFSDALAELLLEFGVENYFAVTGGAAVHLIDSLSRVGVKGTFNHHEQASALAADAHTRLGRPAVCVTTTGPGVTNALTGLLCSWQDSIPTIYLSGQSRTSNIGYGYQVRQSGTQHLSVGPVVESMTKEFLLITETEGALCKIANALNVANSGRQGPVWIDVPLDVQLQDITREDLALAKATFRDPQIPTHANQSNRLVSTLLSKLAGSKQPMFILGAGTKSCDPTELRLLTDQGLPFATTWGIAGAEVEQSQNWVGRVGVSGMRGANLALMRADVLLVIGARLGQSVAGANLSDFAPDSELFVCEIDDEEIRLLRDKLPRANVYKVEAASFVSSLVASPDFQRLKPSQAYSDSVRDYKSINKTEYLDADNFEARFDLYRFLINLNSAIQNSSQDMNVVVDGGGNVVYSSMQTLQARPAMNILIPAASAPMGTGLPHALGAWVANSRNTLLLVGDGSLQFNLQELQNLRFMEANIKIFVLENQGYRSIRSTQEAFLESRYLGSSESGGLSLPSLSKLADAFSLEYRKLTTDMSHEDIQACIEYEGSRIFEVPIKLDQEIYPRVAFQAVPGSTAKKALPLDNMHPVRD